MYGSNRSAMKNTTYLNHDETSILGKTIINPNKQMMKKLTFLLIAMAAFVFAACASAEKKSSSSDGEAKTLVAYFSAQGHTKALAERLRPQPEPICLKSCRQTLIRRLTLTDGTTAPVAHGNQKTAPHVLRLKARWRTSLSMTPSILVSRSGGLRRPQL